MADREGCLDSRGSVGLGSPCEPKEVVETEEWLELRVVGGPGPPWKSSMLVDIEAWLPDLYLPKEGVGPGSSCEPKQVVETGACLESSVGVGPGSPCEPEVVVVDTGTWMESGVGVEPGSSCEPKLVVESEAWLKPRFGHWTGSPWKLQMMVDIVV